MPVFLLSDDLVFPPVHLATPEGLLAVGGDLSPERLLSAYKKGIFPWYSSGDPILWWSPDPRMVLFPEKIKISKSLQKTMRKGVFSVSMDRCFSEVVRQCAQTRIDSKEGTWITAEMMDAYGRLNQLGYAHSVEVWQDSRLAGGLYGVSLGRCFFGESMFSKASNASKVALVQLGAFLKANDFRLIDCQVPNDHLASMGAYSISREEFLIRLRDCLRLETLMGPWHHKPA